MATSGVCKLPALETRDETTLTTMAWCACRLGELRESVAPMADRLVAHVAVPVDVLLHVVMTYLRDVEPVRPTRLDLMAMRSSGVPWSALEAVASDLVAAESNLEFLAYE